MQDFFNARDTLKTKHGTYMYYRLDALEKAGLTDLKRLPFSIVSCSRLPSVNAITARSPGKT